MTNREVTVDVEKAEATSLVENLEKKSDQITSLVENSDENQAARNPDSNSETRLSSVWEWSKQKAKDVLTIGLLIIGVILVLIAAPLLAVFVITILLWGWSVEWIFPKWKKIFVISCVFAVLLDPLFLYIPIIKEDSKCIGMDKSLNKTAFALRTLTDFSYFVDIIVQYHNSRTIWHSYIPIDMLAILPLPQAVIIIFFSKLDDWTRKLMNFLAMTQYVPRVLRIYFSCKEIKEAHKEEIGRWMKGLLNLFLYILASHVIGAFWYFFAIQRMSSCWKFACRRTENGCHSSNIACYDDEFRNTTFLSDLCPINPPNAALFDFGIFLNVLQSNISSSTDHPQKFANCFWWGLRNLSSLGSNLQTSINTWENLFAAFISLVGLLLFLYLVGNLQMYMQLDATREEARKQKLREISEEEERQKKKIERKLEKIDAEVASWLDENTMIIPKTEKNSAKLQIMRMVKHKLDQNKDVDVQNILSILPSDLRKYIDERMTWKKLKEAVPKLGSMDEEVLQAMCKHLKPMEYSEDSYIIRENNPLEMMFFVTDGQVEIETKGKGDPTTLNPGDFYGEELLDWVNVPFFPSLLPLSTSTAMAFTDVEARVLMASDLCSVAALYREHFMERDFAPPPDSVESKRLGLGNLRYSALHIERVPSIPAGDEEESTQP